MLVAHHCYDWHLGSRCGWTCNQLTSKVYGGITGSRPGDQLSPSVRPHNPATGFWPSQQQWSLLNRFCMEQGHHSACRRKWRDPDDVSHCRILSPDKPEWRLIWATLCRWRRCFVADQLWFMTCIREEEEVNRTSFIHFTSLTSSYLLLHPVINILCHYPPLPVCSPSLPFSTFMDISRVVCSYVNSSF